MDRYRPLTSNYSDTPTLFIDTHTPVANLQENANSRIHTASALLESLATITIGDCDAADLLPCIKAAHLLLSDGTDLLGVIEERTTTPASCNISRTIS